MRLLTIILILFCYSCSRVILPEMPENERDFDNDIYQLIQDVKDRKENINEAKVKKDKILKSKKKIKSELWDIFWQEAQYRVGQDGLYITPEMDMANYQSATLTTNQWTELGPDNWNRTTGWNPGVGLARAVSVNKNDTLDILVGSSGGGVWRTKDGGRTWQPKTDMNAGWTQIFSITRNPNNQNDVWANIYTGGVLHSTDGGDTWTANTGAFWQSTKKTLVTTNGVIFVTDNAGIKRSIDNGATFQTVHTISKEDIEQMPNNPNILFASGYGNSTTLDQALFKSTDGGTTWNPINLGTYGRTLVATVNNTVYVAQAYGSGFGYLYKSTDGVNFDTVVTKATINFFSYNKYSALGGGQATYDMTLAVNPNNENEVWLGGIHQWRSLDGGKTWKLMTYWSLPNIEGYNHADQHSFDYADKPYTGSDGGIYKFDTTYKDPVTGYWHDISKGLGIRQFYRIYGNSSVIAGGAQDNGTSFYKNGQWRDWLGADGMDGAVLTDSIWIGTAQYGNLYKTSTAGNNYGSTLGNYYGTPNWVTAIKYKNGKLYTGHGGINLSTDKGLTFKVIGDTAKYKSGIQYNIDVTKNDEIVYGSASNVLVRAFNNNGTYTGDTLRFPSPVYWVTTYPDNPNHIRLLYALATSRVIESFDGGRTFSNLHYNLNANQGRCAVLDTTNLDYYVGFNVGIYRLRNGSTQWENVTNNLPLVPINDLDIIDGKLYAATYGRGVWSIPLDTSTVVINQPPTANAGTDKTYYIQKGSTTASITLNGIVTDDNTGFSSYWKDGTTIYPSQTSSQNNLLVTKPKGVYQFELIATDAQGLQDKDTVQITVLDTNTVVINPSTSVILSGGKVGKSGVSLSWQTSVTNDTFIQSILYISVNGGVWSQIATSSSLTGSYTNNNLSSATTYNYRVVSTSQKSNSTSNTISIKTGGKAQRIPIIQTPNLIGVKQTQ